MFLATMAKDVDEYLVWYIVGIKSLVSQGRELFACYTSTAICVRFIYGFQRLFVSSNPNNELP